MKNKKVLAIVMAVMTAASALVGCGSTGATAPADTAATTEKEDDATVEAAQTTDGEQVTITFMHDWPEYEEEFKQMISDFEAANPDVKVETQIITWDVLTQTLTTAFAAGEAPDVACCWANQMGSFNSVGATYDLTPYLEENNNDWKDSLLAPAVQSGTVNDQVFCIPFRTTCTVLAYNKTMMEENGWEVPKTFSEFEELLAKIKEAGITPISQCYEDWSLLFIWEPVMSAYDPEYTRGLDDYTSKADGPGASGSLQKLVDWANAGYFGDNWLGVINSDDALLGFTTGNAAMLIGGTWTISSIDQNNPDLNYGAFAIPAEDGTAGLVGTAANGFSINANTQNKEAAEAFASYCATKEGQTAWVQAVGGVSASPEIESSHPVAQEISVSGGGNIFRSWQNVLTTYAKTDTADTVWSEDILKVMSGEITVDDMMADVAAIME